LIAVQPVAGARAQLLHAFDSADPCRQFGALKGQDGVKKSILKFAVNSVLKKIAPGCRISDRWAVGKHLGSKMKSRKLKEINFFTSSRRSNPWHCIEGAVVTPRT
jgi:hypothetical protein